MDDNSLKINTCKNFTDIHQKTQWLSFYSAIISYNNTTVDVCKN